MKRLFLLIISLLTCVLIFAQDQQPAPGETALLKNFMDGITLAFSYINWLYAIVFISSVWIVNDTTDADNIAQWLTWFSKVPKVLRTLIVGAVLMWLFAWAFRYSARIDFFKMFISILASMVAYKIGINKILRWVSTRLFGLKFTD